MKKTIIIITATVIFGFGSVAVAGWSTGQGRTGMGYDKGMGYSHGPGMMYQQGMGPWGANPTSKLSDEQIKQLEAQHKAFYEATRELQRDLFQKRTALRAELAKQEPDAAKASGLQQEISGLEGSFAEKRLTHILAMRKINPDIGRNPEFGRGMSGRGMRGHSSGQMGYGRGYHH